MATPSVPAPIATTVSWRAAGAGPRYRARVDGFVGHRREASRLDQTLFFPSAFARKRAVTRQTWPLTFRKCGGVVPYTHVRVYHVVVSVVRNPRRPRWRLGTTPITTRQNRHRPTQVCDSNAILPSLPTLNSLLKPPNLRPPRPPRPPPVAKPRRRSGPKGKTRKRRTTRFFSNRARTTS